MDQETRMETHHLDQQGRAIIPLSYFPRPTASKLKMLDENQGDSIRVDRLEAAAEALTTAHNHSRFLTKALAFMALFAVVTLTAVCGMTYFVVSVTKDLKVSSSNVLTTVTDQPVRIESADLQVRGSELVSRDCEGDNCTPLAVSLAERSAALSSTLSDGELQHLSEMTISSELGATLHFHVLAFARFPAAESEHGSVVSLFTQFGAITLDGERVSFGAENEGVFQRAGLIADGTRRTLTQVTLLGKFRAIAAQLQEEPQQKSNDNQAAGTRVRKGMQELKNVAAAIGQGGGSTAPQSTLALDKAVADAMLLLEKAKPLSAKRQTVPDWTAVKVGKENSYIEAELEDGTWDGESGKGSRCELSADASETAEVILSALGQWRGRLSKLRDASPEKAKEAARQEAITKEMAKEKEAAEQEQLKRPEETKEAAIFEEDPNAFDDATVAVMEQLHRLATWSEADEPDTTYKERAAELFSVLVWGKDIAETPYAWLEIKKLASDAVVTIAKVVLEEKLPWAGETASKVAAVLDKTLEAIVPLLGDVPFWIETANALASSDDGVLAVRACRPRVFVSGWVCNGEDDDCDGVDDDCDAEAVKAGTCGAKKCSADSVLAALNGEDNDCDGVVVRMETEVAVGEGAGLRVLAQEIRVEVQSKKNNGRRAKGDLVDLFPPANNGYRVQTRTSLKKGDRVSLVGFGSFSISKRAARKSAAAEGSTVGSYGVFFPQGPELAGVTSGATSWSGRLGTRSVTDFNSAHESKPFDAKTALSLHAEDAQKPPAGKGEPQEEYEKQEEAKKLPANEEAVATRDSVWNAVLWNKMRSAGFRPVAVGGETWHFQVFEDSKAGCVKRDFDTIDNAPEEKERGKVLTGDDYKDWGATCVLTVNVCHL